ncbi:unnamed protein product, partial [Phytomonas sp. Hart1]
MSITPFHFSFSVSNSDILADKLYGDLQNLLSKWGLRVGAGNWLLKTFNYQTTSNDVANACDLPLSDPQEGIQGPINRNSLNPTSTSGSSSSPLHFDKSAAGDFLKNFFSSPVVQDSLRQAGYCHPKHPSEGESTNLVVSEVAYTLLCTKWVNLDHLIDALVRVKAVRRVFDGDTLKGNGANPNRFETTRLPITKRMEEMLPNEMFISDEVRALFLQANTRNEQHVSSCSDQHFAANNVVGCEDEAEEDDEDDPYYGLMMGSCGDNKFPRCTLRTAYTAEDRREFIYHLAWRLVAGGGAMNQFEDDFVVYRDAVRELYRRLITSIQIQKSDELGIASDKDNSRKVDDLDSVQGATVKYTPEVLSQVFHVHDVEPLRLFPRSDGRIPSNLNYSYVILNPLQQTAVLWYHCS